MGAKTWVLAITDSNLIETFKSNPKLDRIAAFELAKRLFLSEQLEPIEDGDLSFTCPPDDEIYIGCFPGASIIASGDFRIDYPSRLDPLFLNAAQESIVYLHAMHSVVDWFAYAVWDKGELKRSLSLAPDYGVMEDIGLRLPFEEPYWSGQHPVCDPEKDEDCDYPFPFHPLELGEAALLNLFGYQIEGFVDSNQFEPEEIPLAGFKRIKSRKV
jgi:hypothetical protein